MINFPRIIECKGEGFTFQLVIISHVKESEIVDAIMNLIPVSVVKCSQITSVPFYLRKMDVQVLSNYFAKKFQEPYLEPNYAYVPLELGFELQFEDCDDETATMSLFINMGTRENDRILYCGMRGKFEVQDLRDFTKNLMNEFDEITRINQIP